MYGAELWWLDLAVLVRVQKIYAFYTLLFKIFTVWYLRMLTRSIEAGEVGSKPPLSLASNRL